MKETIKNIYHICAAIIAIIIALFSLEYYIDSKIEKQINSPETIKKMVSILRPSLIFSLQGSIIYDIGGVDKLIKLPEIKKIKDKKLNTAIWELEVIPKESLKIAPILECINGDFVITSKRGSGNTWEFTIESVTSVQFHKPETESEPLFRMEIVN